MKKRSLVLVALLFALSTTALAGPPTTAEGLWQYIPNPLAPEDVRVVGGNTFIDSTEVGRWTGTFEGDSTEAGTVVIHSQGFLSFKAIVSFVGKVDGKSGTMEMSVVGSMPDELPGSIWEGKWVILSGTGDLNNLHGQGTWWGPGWDPAKPEEWGNINYLGNIHFEPN